MLRKVFKTILVFTICLGITIPANAGNVSVSDGSAFITKSEFSYELNNLSTRMEQLENSLDSKIDTLVSSYLTRNGVWNGVKQSLLWNEWTHDTVPPSKGSEMQIIKKDVLIDKLSKSGLLFYQGSYYDKSQTDSSTSALGYGFNCRTKGNNSAGSSLYIGIRLIQDDGNVEKGIASYVLLNSGLNNQNSEWATATLALTNKKIPMTMVCFVDKNCALLWQYEINIKMNPTEDNWQWYKDFKPTFIIDSINVY